MAALREFTGPSWTGLNRDDHLLQPVLSLYRSRPDHVVAGYRDGDRFVDVTAREFGDEVMRLARGLVGCGIQPGDRVALMSRTRVEWLQCDYAIQAAGAVTVPIYDTSSAEQIQWIVSDSGAKVLILETDEHHDQYGLVADGLADCTDVFVIDRGGLAELAERGADVGQDEIDRRIGALTIDDLATLIYTSGTTGRPKGCMLTHGNLRANVLQQTQWFGPLLRDDDRSLVFLPLAHSLAKIVVLVGVEKGIAGYMATDIAHVPEELPMVQPTLVVSVPRVFEKVYNKARQTAEKDGREKIFDRAADVAVRWSTARHGGRVPLGLRFTHGLFDVLVYRKLRDAMGGQLRFSYSGGGPLGERLTRFFDGVGIQIYEGYGLTETSPTLTVNRAGSWTPGSVGQPIPGTTIRIADDGEILARGPQIFQGYWNNPVETAEIIDEDGWFHTGDIGELDDSGYLRITGRKKDLIVTAAGKNVAPAPLEDSLRAHPLISQAIVIGDGRPFIAALVAIDEEAFVEWAQAHGRGTATIAEMVDDPDLRGEIQQAVDAANAHVSKAESIKQFTILPRDLTIEMGELTPTLKVKRGMLMKEFDDVVEHVYGS